MTEEQYLTHVLERIRAAIGSVDITVNERVQTLDEQKRYLWENRDIDPHEIRSVRENILNIHAIGESVIARRERLGRILDTPYFGRIDFRERSGDGGGGGTVGREPPTAQPAPTASAPTIPQWTTNRNTHSVIARNCEERSRTKQSSFDMWIASGFALAMTKH